MSDEQTAMSERGPHSIELVGEHDLSDLLPLMRGYCDFYEVDPSDEALGALSRALIDDPARDGLQLIARDTHRRAVGFATVYWSWSTSKAARIGVMNDLYVDPAARGQGLADRLIAACVERCRSRGALELEWQTALDNERAQAVYDRVGGVRERWLSYSLEVAPG
jgi:ribosomal protein S18 acetylase RimI-like enzyme